MIRLCDLLSTLNELLHVILIADVTYIIIITMQRVFPIARQSEKGTQSSRVVWCSHASSMKSARSFGTSPVLSVHPPRNKIWIDLFMTDGMMLSPLNYKSEFQIQPTRSRAARQTEIFTVLRSRPAENLHTRVPFAGMYKWYSPYSRKWQYSDNLLFPRPLPSGINLRGASVNLSSFPQSLNLVLIKNVNSLSLSFSYHLRKKQ